MNIVYLLIGLITGIILGLLLYRLLFGGAGKEAEEKLQLMEGYLKENRQKLEERERELLDLNRQLAAKEADFKNLSQQMAEQKTEVEKLYQKFNTEFKNLANEILEEKSRKFTEQNKTNLKAVLDPLGERLKDFEKKVQEAYDKEAQQRFSLKEEVRNLAELNKRISAEADNLTRALKGDSKTRGSWGEMILESILEKSGLVKDREYFVQPSFTLDDGTRLQPDIIVTYPGDRNVVIDAKVSLADYEKYNSANDEKEKEKALKNHLNAVRNHIQLLSRKNYQDIYDLDSLDFVMLFMPIEPAYLVVIEKDPDLWNYAYQKRILLLSPTNLIAALKMIASLWRQEYQNQNAMEIARQGGALLDKFYSLLDDLKMVGDRLRQTQNAHEDAVKKLSRGRGNLIKRAQDIEALGAKATKTIPDKFKE